MADMNATTTAATTVLGGAVAVVPVTVAGPIFGLHPDALLFGFIAALVTLLLMPPAPDTDRTPKRVFFMVAGASFLAGVFAPPLALAMAEHFAWSQALGQDRRRVICAALIGISVGIEGLPMVLAYIRKRWLA